MVAIKLPITGIKCRMAFKHLRFSVFALYISHVDRLCGLVVRVSGYRYRGLGFDSRRYQIF